MSLDMAKTWQNPPESLKNRYFSFFSPGPLLASFGLDFGGVEASILEVLGYQVSWSRGLVVSWSRGLAVSRSSRPFFPQHV